MQNTQSIASLTSFLHPPSAKPFIEYGLRAEALSDVERLMALVPKDEFVGYALARTAPDFGLTHVALRVNTLSLNQLRDLCRSVEDGHLMLQTVQPIDLYTGERDGNVA